MEDLRYPVGRLELRMEASATERQRWVSEIAACPALMRAAVQGLSEQQLDTPYRPNGWTVRQVVHHVPDSHMNAYIRLRLALTESEPTIKPYNEALWAELADSRTAPVELSLSLLEVLHTRWIMLWHSLKDEDWDRTWRHPEMGRLTITALASLYGWHSRHHVAHITELRKRKGW